MQPMLDLFQWTMRSGYDTRPAGLLLNFKDFVLISNSRPIQSVTQGPVS